MTADRVRWRAVKGRLFGSTGRQGMSLAIAQAITVVAGIGVGAMLARTLGVNGYGQYIFALTIVQLFMIPLDFGLPTLVMREVAVLRARADWGLMRGLLRWSVALLASVLTAIAIGVLTWKILSGKVGEIYLFAVLLAGVWAYLRLGTAVLRGMERVVWAAIPDQVIRPVTMLVALVLISLVGTLTPTLAMALHALATAVGLCWTAWILQLRCRPIPIGQFAKVAYSSRSWFTSLLALGMQVGADFLNSRIDILMLGILSDSRDVGIYGLGVLMGGIARMPETIIKQMATPRIARYFAGGQMDEIRRISRVSAATAVVAASVCLFGIILIGKPIVIMLAGPEFVPAVKIAAIFASSSIVTGLWCMAAPLLNMTGQERHSASISWGSAVANGIINLALIPVLGALGAALATTIVTSGRQAAFAIAARRQIGISAGLALP